MWVRNHVSTSNVCSHVQRGRPRPRGGGGGNAARRSYRHVVLAPDKGVGERLRQLPADAKVTELDLPFGIDQHVGRLDVCEIASNPPAQPTRVVGCARPRQHQESERTNAAHPPLPGPPPARTSVHDAELVAHVRQALDHLGFGPGRRRHPSKAPVLKSTVARCVSETSAARARAVGAGAHRISNFG